VNGTRRAAWSPSTSVATPPSPNTTTGLEHRLLHHADDGLGTAGDHGLDQQK
jgi:hypothetical protein